MPSVIHVENDRSFSPGEYAELMAAARWGDPEAHPASAVLAALDAYHFVGHVRDEAGRLVGYICAFSDGAFATFVGELVVHPAVQGAGIGAALLEAVEDAYPGVPVFAVTLRETRGFFARHGYSEPPRPLDVLTKLSTWPAGPAISLEGYAEESVTP